MTTPFRAWGYLFWGVEMIQDAFEKSDGAPFELYAPDNRYVYVSNPEQIKEIDAAPDSVLSLQTASKQMLQPVYTMRGFNWFDLRGTEGFGLLRAVRTVLTSNLPKILPDLSGVIKVHFDEMHSKHPTVGGSRHSPLFAMVTKLVVISNATSFFGEDVGQNEEFLVQALRFIEETLIGAEIVRLFPVWVAPLVGAVLNLWLKAHITVFNTLVPVAEQRCNERDLKKIGQNVPIHADCIQWVMEAAPRNKPWPAPRIIHELMALWFGSIHALSTTICFAIHDLCLHPEYVDPIRKELQANYAEFKRTGHGLPLLDSFLKESARLTPVESMATRRSALQPFTLSDGTRVHIGNWVCTPVKSIMQDSRFYPNPLQFYGFRFVDPNIVEGTVNRQEGGTQFAPSPQPTQSNFTDLNQTFHFWGTGRCACPGRFYAVSVMKLIIGQMILNYDCELVDKEAPRSFNWRSSTFPRRSTKVVFTPISRD
ncbi:cytochrome P450 [Xylaria sp. FL0043]|nr:cytochrome P450 [Xylaria sp. FL0043]